MDGERRAAPAGPGHERGGAHPPDTGGRPAPVRVPPVVGHHVDVAIRRLRALGLTVRIVTTEIHDKTDRHVVATEPPVGAPCRRPVVELVVGIAPTVADYVGRDADEAWREAERAGHLVEAITADAALTPERAVVVDQEPPVGDRSRVLLLHLARRGTTG